MANVATEPGVSEFANTQIVGALQNYKVMPILRLKSTDSASKAGELIKEISSLKTKPIDVNRPVISSKPNITTVGAGSKTLKSSSGSSSRVKTATKTPTKTYQDKVSAARAAALAAARKNQQARKSGGQASIMPVGKTGGQASILPISQPYKRASQMQQKILTMFRS